MVRLMVVWISPDLLSCFSSLSFELSSCHNHCSFLVPLLAAYLVPIVLDVKIDSSDTSDLASGLGFTCSTVAEAKVTASTDQALSTNDLIVPMSSGIYARNSEINYKTRLAWMIASRDIT
jgi:hypothetical protein